MKKIITLLVIPSLFVGCVLLENDDKRIYFKVEGTGYVYYEKTREPAQNVQVTVCSNFKSYEWATKPAIDEHFYTDNTGFFRIRFLKRTGRQNVVGITIDAYDYNNRLSSKMFSCTVDKLDEFILKLDTLWLH